MKKSVKDSDRDKVREREERERADTDGARDSERMKSGRQGMEKKMRETER